MEAAACGEPTKEPGGHKQEQCALEGLHPTDWAHPGVVLEKLQPVGRIHTGS